MAPVVIWGVVSGVSAIVSVVTSIRRTNELRAETNEKFAAQADVIVGQGRQLTELNESVLLLCKEWDDNKAQLEDTIRTVRAAAGGADGATAGKPRKPRAPKAPVVAPPDAVPEPVGAAA